MSRTHRLGRSLPVAGVAALLVVGASFAHDAAPAATTVTSVTHVIGTGDDDRQTDGLAGTEWESEDGQQGDADDLGGKAEDDASDEGDQNDQGDENDQGEDEDGDEDAPKPDKPAPKVKPVAHHTAPKVQASHDDGDEAEDHDGD